MNARELLKEARDKISGILYYIQKEEGEEATQYLRVTLSKIDAYLAAPSESAMEMVAKIRQTHTVCSLDQFRGKPISYLSFDIHDSDAAALIEGLQRRVPRKMLEDLLDMCFDLGDEYFLKGGKEYAEQAVARILAKHGVEVF